LRNLLFENIKALSKKILQGFDVFLYRQEMFLKEPQEIQVQNVLLSKELGVLHLGGHTGQEICKYNQFGLKVIWIEGNPEIYSRLNENLSDTPNQKAYCALLSDEDGKELDFYISSGDAGSSSIYEFGKELGFSELTMISSVRLKSHRLDSLLNSEDLSDFGHWVVDVQGAELEVLKGAESSIASCRSMFIEVSTREVYKGGTTYNELRNYLISHGLHPLWEPKLNSHENLIFVRPRK
jgi:FkbM family methyltransferase